MPNQTDGSWNPLQQWPLIGLHATVMDDGRILTFGTNSQGMQGGQFIYDIYDPVTGEHTTLPNTTPTDIFCSAAIIIPGTNQILIAGGDARPLGTVNAGVSDVNIFDMDTLSLTPSQYGPMTYQRWYPTMVSLPDGRVVILGGTDINSQGIAVPEIFTPGEGWQTLSGATDNDLQRSPLYTRAFVNNDGNIVYFGTGKGNDNKQEVMVLDPDANNGTGSISEIGQLPFNYQWDSPSTMFEPGKILIQDQASKLWVMDINGATPTFTPSSSISQDRNWSDMTVLADGSVLINGGTSTTNNKESGADTTTAIWNPDTGQITYGVDEDNPRLYHSASVLQADGSVISIGGGAGAGNENNYLDAQVYKPPYLYDANGNLATRPIITDTPDNLTPGETFTITVDNASAIDKLTLAKSGAATHSFNMEARLTELDFTVGPNNTLEVTLPDVAGGVVAGSWMLFAWNDAGVPSIAPMVAVDPVFDTGSNEDPDNLLTNGSFETAADVQDWEIHDYVFGWESSNDNFELWEDGYEGIAATDGATSIEIDGERGTVSQSVETKIGQSYDLTFDYTARANYVSSARMEVLWNGEVIDTVTPTNPLPSSYDLTVIGAGDEGILAFRSIETNNDFFGGLLDNVVLKENISTNPNEVNDIPDVTQYLTGAANDDTFVINGNAGDYGWGPAEDGNSVVVWGPTGHDLLTNFETIKFNDTTISLVQTGNEFIDVPNVTQYLTGTAAQETFVIDGDSSAYTWGATEDGTGFVVWGPTGFDLLFNIENITFSDTTITLGNGNPIDGITVQDDPNITQFEYGTAQRDQFVIDGNQSDFGWGATEDGEGVVVWSNTTGAHDLLYDFEEISFNDATIDITDTLA